MLGYLTQTDCQHMNRHHRAKPQQVKPRAERYGQNSKNEGLHEPNVYKGHSRLAFFGITTEGTTQTSEFIGHEFRTRLPREVSNHLASETCAAYGVGSIIR